jgi:predicted Zn-dependent protease
MNLSVRKPWVLLPLLVVSMSLQQCSCSDVVGSLFVSEADEVRLGGEFHQQLLAKKDSLPVFKADTPARQALKTYLDSLYRVVHSRIPESDRTGYHDNFTFTIIDSDVENAFAVPGGYVYVYTGILKSMNSESELMGVLGHEIAHVTLHHYRDKLAQDLGIQVLVDGLTGGSGQLTQFVGGIFGQMASLSVSRSAEAEADEYGTRYLGNTKRHPLGIAEFFSRMGSGGLTWLSTHPGSDQRAKDVTAQVAGNAALNALARNELRYQTRYREVVCTAGYCPKFTKVYPDN